MQLRRQHFRSGEVGLTELLMMVLFGSAVIAGVFTGVRLASSYGFAAQFVGALVGPIIAIVVAFVALLLLCTIILDPFDRLSRWWRPYPPTCENAVCTHSSGYALYDLPDDLVQRWKGLSRSGYQCRCGFVYAGGYESPLRSRWVRVMPDGTLRPYLRHRPFGRWQPDDHHATVAVPPVPTRPEIQLPRWTAPVFLFAICGGMAFVVTFRDLDTNPLAYPFIICCAILGLTIGTVVEFLVGGSDEVDKRDEQRAE